MTFNTLDYLLFLPVVILLYFLLPQKLRNPLLLLASYVFYLSDVPVLCLFLVAITVVSYLTGLAVEAKKNKGEVQAAKGFAALGIVISLGTLFFYKYFNFVSEAFFELIGSPQKAARLDLLVPLGISFIIFQTVSYIIDVFRGDIHAEKRFFRFALYVSFFPKVVQGPIEKAGDILPQFDEKHEFDPERARYGLIMILFGLFLKLAVADNLAICVNNIYGNLNEYSGAALVAATIMFAFQIYGDFAGYSLIAIGSAKILGFRLRENFRQPYLSCSVSEFWRRWHISLNVWLRDYLYIPLGGSRCSGPRRWANTLITFGLSGLWHGADWGYIIWGLINGFFVSVESSVKRFRKKRAEKRAADAEQAKASPVFFAKLVKFAKCIGTFLLVSLSWLFFRAQNISTSVAVIKRIVFHFNLRGFVHYVAERLSLGEGNLIFGLDVKWRIPFLALFVLIVIVTDLLQERYDLVKKLSEGVFIIRWIVCLFLIFAIIIFGVYGYGYNAAGFIYGAF